MTEPDSNKNKHAIEKTQWSRLSPVSIIFFFTRVLSQLFSQALPALAPLGIVIFNSESKSSTASLLLIGASTLVIIDSVLQYFFYKYKVELDKVIIHEGVLKKKQRVISFDKIQNINIVQPFYFKFFNLVTLQLETAGSKNNEANLAGISFEQAESLKNNILSQRAEINNGEDETDISTIVDPDLILSSATTKDLVKYGVTSNGMFWFFVFLAPFFGALDNIIEEWIGKENITWLIDQLGGGFSGGFVFALAIILSIIILMISFSILGAIFRYHNYKLTFNKNTLKRHSGLLGTHEESAKLPKIQAFVNQTNFIGRWLKVENIALKQASGAQNNQNTRKSLFVIPTRNRKQSQKLLNVILNLDDFHSKLYKINKRYILKNWLMLMFIPLFLSILLSTASNSFYPFLILLLGLPLWPLIFLRWKNFGYAIDEKFATFRSGFLGFKRITFALFKVQRVMFVQSPMQRRKNLATLKIYMASDRITIPYIPISHAQHWFDKISYQVETTNENWF